jgi:Na+/proline symporter
MLVAGIFVYLLLTLIVGFIAARRVKTVTDFALAGKRLSFFMASATVFATWFGSETILGSSAEFAKHGLAGVIEEPFGAALCLILVGIFFARRLYRMNLANFGEFYLRQYGHKTEIVTSVIMVFSYLSWVAAQFLALGIVLNTITGLDLKLAIVLMAAVVTLYTTVGGMWAVSMTDSIQMVVIIVGLIIVLFVVSAEYGGVLAVLSLPPPTHWQLIKSTDAAGVIGFVNAWLVIGIGSIPGQDVFQRVMSARSERVAVFSSIFSGILYLTVAMIPLFIGYLALRILHSDAAADDLQFLIPKLIMAKTSVVIQIVFFGALLSAILSTASGALLAPSVVLSENLLRKLIPNDDTRLLRLSRISTVALALVSLVMALRYDKITELVSDSSTYGLVSLFVPLIAGMFFHSRNAPAAIASCITGTAVWKLWPQEGWLLTPQLAGFTGACLPYFILVAATLGCKYLILRR